jgi:glycosyltransferase involved in cell wall biosynthesis
VAQKGCASTLLTALALQVLIMRLNSSTTLFTCSKKHRWDLATFRSIYHFVKKEKPQVIHSHSTTLLWACFLKILEPNIALIWHDHFGNRKYAKDNVIHILLSVFINAIIAVNDEIAVWLVKHMSVNKESIVYLPNFAMLQPIDVSERSAHTIVMNANLLPVKDHFTLLKALAIIKHKEIPFTAYLIGKEADVRYVAAVKEMITHLQLSNNVTLSGKVNNIEPLLGKASIGVLSSTSEGLPVSLLEYGLAGLAVVTTDVGQCSKVLGDGEFGWIVPPQQPERLAESLFLMLTNPTLAAQKANKLNQFIKHNYSEKSFMKSYLQLVNKLI